MAKWLPIKEGERLLWLQNFVLKLAGYVGTAGVTAADVTLATNILNGYAWLVARTEQITHFKEALRRYKTIATVGQEGAPLGAFPLAPIFPASPAAVSAGMLRQLIRLVKRIKATNGYTKAMGEDLGIESPKSTPILGKPKFKATPTPNSVVRLDWVKRRASGVIVESQRGDETTWTVLGRDTLSPYFDTRAPLVNGVPEIRRYRIRYLMGDAAVGDYSAILTITTTP